MKCYRHPNADAVGICKQCSKGVCPSCSTDVGLGLACSETCVDAVKSVNLLIRTNIAATSMGTRGASGYFLPIFLAVVGALFVAQFVASGKPITFTSFGFVGGLVFVVFGLVLAIIQWTARRKLRAS